MDRQFNLQVQENVQDDGFSKKFALKEYCPFHEKVGLDFICVKSQHESVFNCIYCVVEEIVKPSNLIPIDQVLKAEKRCVFDNFPFTDRSFTNEIKQVADSLPTGEAIKQNIEKYFKEFRAKFLHKLSALEANSIQKAQSISDYSKGITKLYNEISQKSRLFDIISDQKQPTQTKSDEIKVLCSEVSSKIAEHTTEMRNSLDKLKLLQTAIDFETPNKIKETVIKQLDQINIFLVDDIELLNRIGESIDTQQSPLNSNSAVSDLMKLISNKFNEVPLEQSQKFEEQLKGINFIISQLEIPQVGSSFDEIEKLDEEQVKLIKQLAKDLVKNKQVEEQLVQTKKKSNDRMQLKADDLIALISNKTNFCSRGFLEDSVQVIRIAQGILEQFYVRKTNIDSNELAAFNELEDNQLINFSKLAIKVNELSKKFGNSYIDSKRTRRNERNNSSIIQRKLFSQIKSKDQKQENEKTNILNEIFINFPIFELLPPISEFLGQKFLPIEFTRTKFLQSSEIRMSKNGKGKVSLSIDANIEGQVVTQTLNNNAGYLLKLKFNKPYNHMYGQFRIALALNSQIDTCQIPPKNESGFCSALNYGGKKVIRGQLLSTKELKDQTDSLEFRWCISKRQFFFADKSYTNINQVEETKIDPFESYCFGINMTNLPESDWVVTVTEFSEINPNDVEIFVE